MKLFIDDILNNNQISVYSYIDSVNQAISYVNSVNETISYVESVNQAISCAKQTEEHEKNKSKNN